MAKRVFVRSGGKLIPKSRYLARKRRARGARLRRMGMGTHVNVLRTKRTWHSPPAGEGSAGTSWDIYWDSTLSDFVNCRGQGRSFKLNDLPNYTEFTTLFDAYRIKGVKLEFLPIYNSHEINEGPASSIDDRLGMPIMNFVFDQDDATSPPNENTLLQYATNKRVNLSTRKTIYISAPRTSSLVHKDGVNPVGYSENKSNQWIDSAYPDVPHYGLKYFIPVENTSKILYVRVYATYYLEFKRVI